MRATLALTLILAACGGKVSTDVTIPQETGDGGTTDGGATDGGSTIPTDGGTTIVDEDGDGWSPDDGDCNDDDPNINPDATDVCYDDVDSDCDGSNDFDCDGDGYESSAYEGDDCLDTDDSVYPEASETRADGIDSDCDGAVDEDAYCNVYAPMSNATSSYRTYATISIVDGGEYIETTQLQSYDEANQTVTLSRVLDNGAGSTSTISEEWACAEDGTVTVSGYRFNTFGTDLLNITFSAASARALPQEQMVPGNKWDIVYDATDAAEGLVWSVQGTATVLPQENITTTAGIFATLPVEVTYSLTSYSDYATNREATVTWYLAPGVGTVYSLEILADGSVGEERELSSYSGFYAMDPSEFTGE